MTAPLAADVTSAAAVIDIRGLSKRYPGAERPAVDNISLQVRAGSVFGLLGPNGAGKTTLLSMLCGLATPDSGELWLFGEDARRAGAHVKQAFGLVPQDLALYPTLTARENMLFFGSMQGLTGKQLHARIDVCLGIARLEDYADRRVHTFSGGLKRRLNLAISLLHEPRLLVLDEPTVGMDPQSRNFIYESLKQLNRDGMTIVYTTHYMEEVEQLCNDIAIIDQGRIIARGSLDALLAQHGRSAATLRLREPLATAIAAELQPRYALSPLDAEGRLLSVALGDTHNDLRELLDQLHAARVEILSLTLGACNLEQLFLRLTGMRLRD